MTAVEKELLSLRGKYNLLERAAYKKAEGVLLQRARATGKTWLTVKPWRKFIVDYELRGDWLVTLNGFAERHDAKVMSVCAGHPHDVSGHGVGWDMKAPSFSFLCRNLESVHFFVDTFFHLPETNITVNMRGWPRLSFVIVKSSIKHSGKNQKQLEAWWGSVISSVL